MQVIQHGNLTADNMLFDASTNVISAVGWGNAQLDITSCNPDKLQRAALVALDWHLGHQHLPTELTLNKDFQKSFLEAYVPDSALRRFLQGLMHVDPSKRWTVEEALEHDFIKGEVIKVSYTWYCC
jgi:serine/threonine protein kinase